MNASIPPRPDVSLPEVDDARPRATWRWWEVVALTLAGFLAGSIAAAPVFVALDASLESTMGGPGLLAAAIVDVVLVGVLLLWLRSAHRGWVRILGWPPRGRRLAEAAAGVALGVLVVVGSFAAGGLVTSILGRVSGTRVQTPEQVSSDIHGGWLVVFLVFAIAIAPATEEFVFRGLLFRSLADRYGFWFGAIASSIPFGLTHAIPGRVLDVWALMITLMFVGLGLAWIHWRRRNLLANIVAHATFNVIGVTLILTHVGS